MPDKRRGDFFNNIRQERKLWCRLKLAVQARRAAVPRTESFGPVPNGENRPVADIKARCEKLPMRCYYVLVHGRLRWISPPPTDGASQPRGFYCHRHVLASDELSAQQKAFQRVLLNLDREGKWLSEGAATVELEAEDVFTVPFYNLLKPENRGHAFYEQE